MTVTVTVVELLELPSEFWAFGRGHWQGRRERQWQEQKGEGKMNDTKICMRQFYCDWIIDAKDNRT